ncbi:MAG: proton-conducting transporter membrane subunit [Chloroflexota bacterium]
MFIAWELTSIASFFLIGFYHEKEASQKSALQALLVTGHRRVGDAGGFVGLTAVPAAPPSTKSRPAQT